MKASQLPWAAKAVIGWRTAKVVKVETLPAHEKAQQTRAANVSLKGATIARTDGGLALVAKEEAHHCDLAKASIAVPVVATPALGFAVEDVAPPSCETVVANAVVPAVVEADAILAVAVLESSSAVATQAMGSAAVAIATAMWEKAPSVMAAQD